MKVLFELLMFLKQAVAFSLPRSVYKKVSNSVIN